MNKNWLIIQREYLSRVKKRSFILMTLLTPLIIVIFIALEIFIFSGGGKENKEIAVVDQSGLFDQHLQSKKNLKFITLGDRSLSSAKEMYKKAGYDGLLFIPDIDIKHPKGFTYYADHQLGLNSYIYITDQLNSVIKNRRMILAGIHQDALDKMTADVTLSQHTSSNQSSDETKYLTLASSAIGYVSGFLIYFALILFGTQVLRGVAEEKTNRISEIMVSSVKPSQLMTGKIIGIGAVGLTQFIIWILLALAGFFLFGSYLAHPSNMQNIQQMGAMNTSQTMEALQQVRGLFNILPIAEIIFCFLFYFFGGYLFYSALFAAVGSAVDQDMTESQSLTLPITMPIIVSFFIMFGAIQAPNSTLAVFCSIFPLSSPIVMMARIPYGVPAWQLILSIVLLIAGLLFTIKVAAKIYRTGILLYGKKVTFKELIRWAFRKSSSE